MGWMSTTLRDRILNSVLRAAAWTAIPGVKLALYTGDPGASGTANEVSGGSYARQAISHGAASAGACAISGTAVFADMPGCTISHVGYWSTDGVPVFLGGGALAASKVINAGDSYTHNLDTLSGLSGA